MTEKKRKRPSRRQASKKSVWGWLFFRPRFLKGAIRVGRLALFLWSLWHKLKDDLWTFYFLQGDVCAERRSPLGKSFPRHVSDGLGWQTEDLQILSQ